MIVVGACTTAFMPSFLGASHGNAYGVRGGRIDRAYQFGGKSGGFAGPYFIGYLRNTNRLVYAGTACSCSLRCCFRGFPC